MTTVLETVNLSRVHGAPPSAVRALDGVSLAVEAGELLMVTGPSGCGKSTLLNLLGGLDRPTDGEVWLEGERIDGLSETRRALLRRTRIGLVFQFFNLIANLSVAENVELPALLAGVPRREARASANALLERFGVAAAAERVPSELSGGQQQRVAIARALINRPAILLADEPTGNLDTAATATVMEALRESNEAGQTIVMITHDPQVAAAGDRVMRMRDGRVSSNAREGKPALAGLARTRP